MYGYLLIIGSSIFLCIMSALRKEFQKDTVLNVKTTLFFMGLSSLFVLITGLIYCAFTRFELVTNTDMTVLYHGALFAIILTLNTILCIFVTKYGSMAISTVFAWLGTLVISAVYGLVYNPVKNALSVWNIIGFGLVGIIIAISLFSVKVKSGENDGENKRNVKIFALLCFIIFFTNGIALPIYSHFTDVRPDYGEINFIFLYLFFCLTICAVVLCAIMLARRNKNDVAEIKGCVEVKPLICILGYGATFFFSEFLSIVCTQVLPIIIQAPLSFAVSIISVALVDFIFFKQKLTKAQIVQIALSFIVGLLFAF